MAEESEEPAAPAEDGPISGLFKSLANLLATLIAIGQTRIELLTTELQYEIHRSAEIVIWILVALLAASMTLLWIAILIVVWQWETHRLLAGLSVIAFFLIITVIALLMLRATVRAKPRILDATRTELARDREALEKRAQQ